jgi:hypothetical protein
MHGERLDAEWVRAWAEQSDAALRQLMRSFLPTHGFPPGDNAVTPATDADRRATDALTELAPVPSGLTTLYRVISEADLPDVDHGYFIHPRQSQNTSARRPHRDRRRR